MKLPNLIQKNSKKDFQKDCNYKICYNEYRKKEHNKNSKIGLKQLVQTRHGKDVNNEWLYKRKFRCNLENF